MTLHERCMDESDVERDPPDIDYCLVKKFTSKLPKIGTSIRGRRVREGDRGPSSSSSILHPQLSPLSVVINDNTGDVDGVSSSRNVRGESVGPESRHHFFSSPDIGRRESNNLSPSHDSQESLCSSELRMKKKPHFQRMLEKAREEDHKNLKSEKPLYQRILDKAQADFLHEEGLKQEHYKGEQRNAVAQKRTKLPKIIYGNERPSPLRPEISSPEGVRNGEKSYTLYLNEHDKEKEKEKEKGGPSPRTSGVGVRVGVGVRRHSDAVREGSHGKIPPLLSPSSPRMLSGLNYSPSAESVETNAVLKKKVSKKPLFQRLQERAQADEERATREKMEQYNAMRIMKKKSSAPSREEIKERIDQGIARNDENLQKGRDQEERERRDRDKEYSSRLKKRQRALGVQSLPKGSVMGPYSNSPMGPNQDPHFKVMSRKGRGERSRVRALSTEEEDEGYRGDDGDNDSVTKTVKIKHRPRVTGRARTLEKLPPNINANIISNIASMSIKRSKEEDVFPVSEAESKRMAEMMLELHAESRSNYYDNNVPMVSCDSPSSLNISGSFSSKNIHAGDRHAHGHGHRHVEGEGDGDGIDALFSPFSAASSDTDSFIRQMKERSGEVTSRSKGTSKMKASKGKWSPKRGDDLEERDKGISDSGNVSEDGDGVRTGGRFNKYDCIEVKERKRTETFQSRLLSSKLSRDMSKSDLKSSSVYSQQPFGLVGPQWVAEVLESDENEQGLVMMYSEGFSMFMAEVGIIDDPLLSFKSEHSGDR